MSPPWENFTGKGIGPKIIFSTKEEQQEVMSEFGEFMPTYNGTPASEGTSHFRLETHTNLECLFILIVDDMPHLVIYGICQTRKYAISAVFVKDVISIVAT